MPEELPDYVGKCQIIELQKWTERQYEEENSMHFLAQFSTYLEGKARGEAQKARRQEAMNKKKGRR